MEWFIFWFIINCVVGYLIGQQKNDVPTAIVLSILLGPIGWLIAGLSKGNLRKCPHCAEFVKPEATVCRHCGKELPELRMAPKPPLPEPDPPATKSDKIALAVFLAVVVIAAIIYALAARPRTVRDEGVASTQSARRATPPPSDLTYFWSLTITKPVELKNSVGRVIAKLEQGHVEGLAVVLPDEGWSPEDLPKDFFGLYRLEVQPST